MTPALTAGPLSADMVPLLTEGRSVLRRASGELAVVAGKHKKRFTYALLGGEFGGRGFPEDFTYLGERSDDGWITGSWSENPVPGRRVILKMRDGFTCAGHDRTRWAQRDEPTDIIAFRLVEEATPARDSGSSADADTHRATDRPEVVL